MLQYTGPTEHCAIRSGSMCNSYFHLFVASLHGPRFTLYCVAIEFGSEWAKVEEDCRMAIHYDSHSVKVSLSLEIYLVVNLFKCFVYVFQGHAAHHTK